LKKQTNTEGADACGLASGGADMWCDAERPSFAERKTTILRSLSTLHKTPRQKMVRARFGASSTKARHLRAIWAFFAKMPRRSAGHLRRMIPGIFDESRRICRRYTTLPLHWMNRPKSKNPGKQQGFPRNPRVDEWSLLDSNQ
jgi:hypothetical protein